LEVSARTTDLPASERFGYWREMMFQMVAPVEVSSDQVPDFPAEMLLRHFGGVQVARVRCASFEISRSPRLIRQSDPEMYQVSISIRGQAGVAQGGHEAVVGPRGFVLFDTSRPFHGWTRVDGGMVEGINVSLPRALLPLRPDAVRRLVAAPLSGHAGVGALLLNFVVGLTRQAKHLRAADHARLSTILLDLLAAALAHEVEAETELAPEVNRRVLLSRVLAFIHNRLGDPALSPAMVAREHHVSLRYLHRLFEEHGLAVAGWIRTARLERCRRDLADPLLRAEPIHAIAARWGFLSAPHFTRTFRDAYGMSPREYRQTVR
jgi:AraC-like DNA-binding protein